MTPLLDHSIRYDHPVSASADIAAPRQLAPVAVFQLAGPGKREEARTALGTAIGAEIERPSRAPADLDQPRRRAAVFARRLHGVDTHQRR